jgi:hypothetical protein
MASEGPSEVDSDEALPVTARRAKRENGGLGEDPPGSTTYLPTGPSDLEVQSVKAKHWSFIRPHEARRRLYSEFASNEA